MDVFLGRVARGGAVGTQQCGPVRAVSDTISHRLPILGVPEPLKVSVSIFYPSEALK